MHVYYKVCTRSPLANNSSYIYILKKSANSEQGGRSGGWGLREVQYMYVEAEGGDLISKVVSNMTICTTVNSIGPFFPSIPPPAGPPPLQSFCALELNARKLYYRKDYITVVMMMMMNCKQWFLWRGCTSWNHQLTSLEFGRDPHPIATKPRVLVSSLLPSSLTRGASLVFNITALPPRHLKQDLHKKLSSTYHKNKKERRKGDYTLLV